MLRRLALLWRDPDLQANPGDGSPQIYLGMGFQGLAEGYGGDPRPDANLAVGTDAVIQTVNTSFAVWDKKGRPKCPAKPLTDLWSGTKLGCAKSIIGDPIVLYDKGAQRWVISYMSQSTKFLECMAISETSDPTGAYRLFQFPYDEPIDYPKIGIWPNAYYLSFKLRGYRGDGGALVCAYDRLAMLGTEKRIPTQRCFKLASYPGFLPSDLDGSGSAAEPPTNYYVGFGEDPPTIRLWRFTARWSKGELFKFGKDPNCSPDATLSVGEFFPACSLPYGCVAQPDVGLGLSAQGESLMHRAAYRAFADHTSIVVNHSVYAHGGVIGVRWYEIRDPEQGPKIHQQSTFSPDDTNRWMGSIAMDRAGDIALGYSVSSQSTFPAIRITGQPATNSGTNQMGQEMEVPIPDDRGSFVGPGWGDYTSMVLDPDDCTMWYTNQYVGKDGRWNTWITSLRFRTCMPQR